MPISLIRRLLTRRMRPRCPHCGALVWEEPDAIDRRPAFCQSCGSTLPAVEAVVQDRIDVHTPCLLDEPLPKPPSAKASCEVIGDTMVIRLRRTSFFWRVANGFFALWLIFWAFGCALCVWKLVSEPSLKHGLVTVGMITIWVLVFIEFKRSCFGWDRFELGPDGFEYRAASLVCGGAERFDLASIVSITHCRYNDDEDFIPHALSIHTDRRAMWLGLGVSAETVAWLADTMARHLEFLKTSHRSRSASQQDNLYGSQVHKMLTTMKAEARPSARSNPDTTRRRHPGSAPTIGAGRFIPGGALFGALFALGGTLMLLAAAGVISAEGWPPTMLIIFASPFLAVGLGLMCSEYLGLRRARRMEERQLRHPGKVWYTDYPWNESGADDGNLRQAVGTSLTAFFLTVFLAPFNLMVFADPSPLFILGITLFDILLLCMYGASVICWVRLLRFGRSRIRFGRFPFFLGQTLEVTFLGPRSLARASNLIFTLRCIVGERELDSKGRSRTALYQVYADSCSLTSSRDSMGSRFTIDLAFPLPKGDCQTCLRGGTLRYWELHVQVRLPLSSFRATFLVPVYAER